uniref:SCP domain-containing protein n=1 Tax=Romanomermis culicivorax TaxID=13658 RepID=A0A915IM52_ROMCU
MLLFLISGILFQFIDVSGQGTPYNFNEDEIKLILHEHNRYRASEPAANMQELVIQYPVWNENLVDVAREWATKCIGDHRPNRSFKAGFAAVGENLWWTSSSVLWKNLRRVIWDFYREKYIYDFNTGYCPPGQLCGHYTQ